MFQHDCLDTYCFECLIWMCFVFLYLHLFTWKGALENTLIIIMSVRGSLVSGPERVKTGQSRGYPDQADLLSKHAALLL